MLVLRAGVAGAVLFVRFGPGGRTLVAGGRGGFSTFDLAAGTDAFTPAVPREPTFAAACDPLGRGVAVSDYLGGFRFYSSGGTDFRRLPGDPNAQHVISLAFAPDGSRLVVCRGVSGDGRLESWLLGAAGEFAPGWAVRDGQPVAPGGPYPPEADDAPECFQYGVAAAPDGRTVVALEDRRSGPQPRGARGDGQAVFVVRDAATGEPLTEHAADGVHGYRTGLAFTPAGRLLVWVRAGVRLLDPAAGGELGRTRGRAVVAGLAAPPAGDWFLTAGGTAVRVWDADTLRPRHAYEWNIGKLSSVAVSPDGLLAAAGGDKGRVVVWDL